MDQADHNTEISVTDIFATLWRRRGLIFILPCLSGVVGLALVLLLAIETHTPIVHYVSLTSIQNGKYPNGVEFSPTDMKAPEVLAELSGRINLDNAKALMRAINVVYDAPTSASIIKKYNDRISQNNLSAAEIDAANSEFNREMKRDTESTAKILVDYQSLGLSEDTGMYIAELLPLLWAEIYTTKFRILDSTLLSGSSQIKTLHLDTAAASVEASYHVNQMLESLKVLMDDNRLSALQTSNGVTPSDLFARVENFDSHYLNAILARNLSSSDELTRSFQTDLILRSEKVDELVAGIDNAINSIQGVIGGVQTSVGTAKTSGESHTQITGDAIGDIIDLVNKSSLSEYLQELLIERSSLIAERAELNLRIQKISKKTTYSSDYLTSTEYLTFAEKRLSALNVEYTELLSRARQMNRINNSTLSRALGSPRRVGSMIPDRGFLIIILSIMIGGFVAAALALIVPKEVKNKA